MKSAALFVRGGNEAGWVYWPDLGWLINMQYFRHLTCQSDKFIQR